MGNNKANTRVSGALKPTKRAKNILKELQDIKNTYVYWSIGHNDKEWKAVLDKFTLIEDYIIELSAGKRVMEAELAEKLKK